MSPSAADLALSAVALPPLVASGYLGLLAGASYLLHRALQPARART